MKLIVGKWLKHINHVGLLAKKDVIILITEGPTMYITKINLRQDEDAWVVLPWGDYYTELWSKKLVKDIFKKTIGDYSK